MLLYILTALVTPFTKTLIIKGITNSGIIPTSCPSPALLTPFPDAAFINEEATGCINQATIGTIIGPRNPPSCFLISCFTVSVAPSVKRP